MTSGLMRSGGLAPAQAVLPRLFGYPVACMGWAMHAQDRCQLVWKGTQREEHALCTCQDFCAVNGDCSRYARQPRGSRP